MNTPTPNGKRREAEAWWPLLRDMAAFIAGIGILVAQTLVSHPQPVMVGAALALLGVTGAGRVQEGAKRRAREEDA